MITKKQMYFVADAYDAVSSSLDEVLVGQQKVKKVVTASLLCNHNSKILLTGNTAAGKTSLSKFLSSGFKSTRISVSSDLIPSDIQNQLKFRRDLQFLLIDEFNRASGKVQSSFIEFFEEHQMNINGVQYEFGDFYVVATQNSVDISGIFNIPQAIYDRFDVNIYFERLEKQDKHFIIFNNFKPAKQCSVDLSILKRTSKIVEDFELTDPDKQVLSQVFDLVDTMKIGSKNLFAGDNIRAHQFALKVAKLMALVHGRDYILPTDIADFIKYIYMHRIDQNVISMGKKELEDKFHEVENKVKVMKRPGDSLWTKSR